MPIVNNAAADAFYTAYKASLGWAPSPEDDAKAKAAFEAGLGAFLDYIKANAVVTSSGADPQGGLVASTGTIA